MKTPYFQINAFTNQFNGGNPAGVCPLNEWLSDALMQKIAAENNLSETAFFVANAKDSEADYHLRWFTPSCEVDLCGHATLAAAHYCFHFAKHPLNSLSFNTLSGTLNVTRSSSAYHIELPTSAIKPCKLPTCFSGLGKFPIETYCNEDYLLVFDNEDDIKNMKPDFDLIQQMDLRCAIVTAKSNQSDIDFVSRVFGSKSLGIPEDPATGSTHTTLTEYWSKQLDKTELVGAQLSDRGALLNCSLKTNSVIVSGGAYCYSEGFINLP